MSELFLAVDAGNSKTVAVLGLATGEILGRGRAGVGDIYGVLGADGAVQEVWRAVDAALAVAGARAGDIRHAAFRLAGIDWPEDEEFWNAEIRARLPRLTSWSIKNDGFSVLREAAPSGQGVAIVAGTGAAVAARGPAGHEFSASFWIQDGMGGLSLGDAALRAVVKAELGIEPQTALSDALVSFYEVDSVQELLHAFTRRSEPLHFSQKARAARLVLAAAGAGDGVARRIVDDQAKHFAGYAAAAARRVHFDPAQTVPIVLGGSIVASEHGVFRDAVTQALGRTFARPEVVCAFIQPVIGTLIDALVEAGVSVDTEIRQRMTECVHPADFFTT